MNNEERLANIQTKLTKADEVSYINYQGMGYIDMADLTDASEDMQWLIDQLIELLKFINKPPGPFKETEKMLRG